MEEGAEAPSEHRRNVGTRGGGRAAMEEGAEAPSEQERAFAHGHAMEAAMEEGAEAPSEVDKLSVDPPQLRPQWRRAQKRPRRWIS